MWDKILNVSGMVSVFVALALAACGGDEGPTFNTDHPEHGKIVLTTDWSQRGQGVDVPGSYCVRVDGDKDGRQTFKKAVNELPGLFDPGEHHLNIWNDAEGITVIGDTALLGVIDVDWLGGSPIGQSSFLNTDIGWLFSAAMDVEVEADRVHEVTAVVEQRVRELTLVVETVGETEDRIEYITAMISGVAGSFDIDSGAHGAPFFVLLPFRKITEGADAGKWAATVRLLGIADGAAPRLTGVISFDGGEPANMALDSDLSGALADFNDGMETPVVIGGTVVETPAGAGFAASISGWVMVDRPGVDANR